jgi:hypothetical protein
MLEQRRDIWKIGHHFITAVMALIAPIQFYYCKLLMLRNFIPAGNRTRIQGLR